MLNVTQKRAVGNIGDIFFTIPRPNVLDAIGANIQIAYSVRSANGNTTHSRPMTLSFKRQSQEPLIKISQNNG